MLRLIRKCLPAIVLLACVSAAFASDCCVVSAEHGFVSLSSGKDLSGWTVMGSDSWTIKDGVITCDGKGGGWLRSNKEYKDFVLRLEYKVADGGNSGVFLRATEEGNPAYTGMEIQILGDHGKDPFTGSAAALYGAVTPSVNATKPPAEWNKMEISCIGERLRVTYNGKRVLNVDLGDKELNARLGDQRLDARAKTGYIGFQNHGDPIQFRNIEIRRL